MARNRFNVDETLEKKTDLGKLKRAFGYVKPYRKLMFIALICTTLASICALLPTKFMETGMNVAIPNKNIPQILILGVLSIAVMLVAAGFGTLRGIIMARVGQNIVYSIRSDLFAHLQKLPFSYYDSRPHGKILVRVVNYVNSVSDTLSNGMINLIVQLLNIGFIVCFMLVTNVQITLYVLIGLPILAVFIFLTIRAQRKADRAFNNKNSNLTAYTVESIEGVKVSQVFDRAEENMRVYQDLNHEYQKTWYRKAYLANMLTPFTENIQMWMVALVYIAGVLWLGGSTGVAVGTIVAMAVYASRFWQPIINLATIYNNFLTTLSYLERIFQTMDEPVVIENAPEACALPSMQGDVEFRNVDFSYDEGHPVLHDISFRASRGESIAIVGETGGGKSTIVSLISRFYDVTNGQVLIDGVDVRQIELHALRSQMGIMLQDSFIFSGTVADNIRYGKADATDDEIRAACRAVCADEFIEEMPNGYDTVINERGSSLSQGQKQLIAFARTLLSNPAILVLDEATSSIDARTERLLQHGIEKLLEGRTSFIIAHRLSTIRRCDEILYVEKGRIIERGTHEELMQLKGKYYHLCTVQSGAHEEALA